MEWAGFSGWEWVASGLLAATLGWICVTDIRTFRIPDMASIGLLFVGLSVSFWSPLVTPAQAVFSAAGAYAVFAGLGSAYFRCFGRDGLGLGDAKLLGAAGAWLGAFDLPLLVAVAAISALVFAALTRQRRLAFGPWLSGAFWIVWIVRISA